jgi:hypothetical protein
LLIRIQYPLLPVVVTLLLALLALAGVIAGAVLAGTTKRYDVMIDGAKRAVAIKAFGSAEVRDANGAVVGQLKRGLGRPTVTQVASGHTLVLK